MREHADAKGHARPSRAEGRGRHLAAHRPLRLDDAGIAALRRAVDGAYPTASPHTRRMLVELGHVHRFARHDRIIVAGDPAQLVLLLDGVAVMLAEDGDGHGCTTLVLRPRDVAGLRSLSDESWSRVSVVALTTGSAATWPGASVRALVAADAGFSAALLDLAVREIKVLERRVVEMTVEQARERFVEALLAYEPLISRPDPAISRSELASIMGVTREMLGVVIRDLERRRLIRRDDAVIEIVDRTGLLGLLCHDLDGDGDVDEKEEPPGAPVPVGVRTPGVTGHD